MHHLVFGINFQIHSVSLTILVSIHLLIYFSTHLCHHPHSRHPSFLQSFTPGSKPTFSTNPSHSTYLLPIGLPHDNWTGPDVSRSSFYFLFHILMFLFIPCSRLSWLPVRFLMHVNTHYRIVQKVIHGLSNRAIFNDFNRPQTQISRSGHCLTLNISEMAKDTAIVTMEGE